MFEREPMQKLVSKGQLNAYKYGFWQCMDTMRDKSLIDDMIKNNAPDLNDQIIKIL